MAQVELGQEAVSQVLLQPHLHMHQHVTLIIILHRPTLQLCPCCSMQKAKQRCKQQQLQQDNFLWDEALPV